MAKKMLIDATHAEETRVVVVDGNKVEEFDFESENKRQLAGNIYLAKVTRVEPSLQAAFIDYGGNRHGFLAFSEIHPDYYQIPVADREALIAEEKAYAEALAAEEEEKDKRKASGKSSKGRGRGRSRSRSKSKAEEAASDDAVTTREVTASGMDVIDLDEPDLTDTDDEGLSPAFTVPETPVETPAAGEEDAADVAGEDGSENGADDSASAEAGSDETAGETADGAAPEAQDAESEADVPEASDPIESVADDDTTEDIAEEIRRPRKVRPRKYKIQEVIKVRQILLVQVVKEERGNKGAALTTYLSLAGRYCVLMPNTARGGGISRKITNAADRKKLKEIANTIEVPDGAGLIIRTAGAQRTKTEIKRDYEYLQRLWEQIRELTLKSIAPAKIYEEGNLIKRSIRDLYTKEIDEVLVEGEAGYRVAKDFMKMIMPSHAKNVKLYKEPLPLFSRFQVEGYLASMFNPTVQLKSGGYIVIGVTEALVAIDVNSGRATKEGSIEETALKTNLEAAEEVARQLRLRDLAGLIVIDFIDMEERRNNSAVEKRFKDRLKHDRARIQVGRISGFGLMEMSRQRLRPGMIEATTQPCPHCHGTGLIRSDDNLALAILRQLEEEGTRRRSREVLVKAPVSVANYLMNQKREHIAGIEATYGLSVRVEADPFLISPDFSVEKFKTATRAIPEAAAPVVSVDASLMADIDENAALEVVEDEAVEEAPAPKKRRRRRRRRRSSGSDQGGDAQQAQANGNGNGNGNGGDGAGAPDAAPGAATSESGGAGEDRTSQDQPREDAAAPAASDTGENAEAGAADTATAPDGGQAEPARKTRKVTRSRKRSTAAATPATADSPDTAETPEAPADAAPSEAKPAPKRRAVRRKTTMTAQAAESAQTGDAPAQAAEPAAETAEAETAEEKPKKKATRKRAKPKAKKAEPSPDVAEAPESASESAPDSVPESAPEASPEPAPKPAPEPAMAEPEPVAAAPAEAAEPQAQEPEKPKKKGWWSLR